MIPLLTVFLRVCFADPKAVFKNLSSCHPNMTAYMKKDIPERLHYKNNERIPLIILIADEGWTIVQRGNKLERCTPLNCPLSTVIAESSVLLSVVTSVDNSS